jgi:hypothetical protein
VVLARKSGAAAVDRGAPHIPPALWLLATMESYQWPLQLLHSGRGGDDRKGILKGGISVASD